MSVSTVRKRISRYINFTVLEKTIFVFTLCKGTILFYLGQFATVVSDISMKLLTVNRKLLIVFKQAQNIAVYHNDGWCEKYVK